LKKVEQPLEYDWVNVCLENNGWSIPIALPSMDFVWSLKFPAQFGRLPLAVFGFGLSKNFSKAF
jgi:hypothetical protein